ncbi:MAG: aspartyl protease family protein, partial [Candidatus Caenarcaniphilales bacterium]|nr:aspartyl protease family protein [Candidatus Caenarcaniphilales bacterium]
LTDKLGLKCIRRVKVAGAGTGSELHGCIVQAKSLRMQGIEAKAHNIIVLEEDVLHLSSYAGVKVHGLIGYDLFSRFIIKINYLARSVTFYQPDHYTTKFKKQTEQFPLSIEEMKPYIQAEAIIQEASINSTPTPIKLILDTGAGHSLSLDRGTHPDIQVPSKSIASLLGMTLNGAVEGAVGRIEKFKLGSFELQKVITSFPDSNSLKFIKGLNQRHGNVGCGVLQRFHLVFDYPHQRLLLTPNRKFKEPFEFNTSGIELTAEGNDFREYVIGSVRANSPAEEMGLQRGDKIISIDDELASKHKLSELYKMLNKKPGRRVLLFLQRHGQMFITELVLRDPF